MGEFAEFDWYASGVLVCLLVLAVSGHARSWFAQFRRRGPETEPPPARIFEEVPLFLGKGDRGSSTFNQRAFDSQGLDSLRVLESLAKVGQTAAPLMRKGHGFAVVVGEDGKSSLIGIKPCR